MNNISSSKVFLGFAAIACTLAGANVDSLRAEGSTQGDGVTFGRGNFGINRVVRSRGDNAQNIQGFVGIRGNIDLAFAMRADENGKFTAVFNPFNNKPSMYIGGEVPINATNNIQIDGGVQFEPATFPDAQGTIADVGWSMFFAVGHTWLNPKIYNPNNSAGDPWRGGSFNPTPHNGEGSISGSLEFTAQPDGTALLAFGNMQSSQGVPGGTLWFSNNRTPNATHRLAPWADQNHPANVVFDIAEMRYANMKTVVALTRPSTASSKLDGSTMVGAWSNREVLPYGQTQGAPNGGWLSWNWNQVNQPRTGYDAPREGHMAFSQRYNGRQTTTSPPIVRFSLGGEFLPAMREGFLATTRPDNYERYAGETVTLDLSMMARPVGNAIE